MKKLDKLGLALQTPTNRVAPFQIIKKWAFLKQYSETCHTQILLYSDFRFVLRQIKKARSLKKIASSAGFCLRKFHCVETRNIFL